MSLLSSLSWGGPHSRRWQSSPKWAFHRIWGTSWPSLSLREQWSPQVWEETNITPGGRVMSTGRTRRYDHPKYHMVWRANLPNETHIPFYRNISLPVLAPKTGIFWIRTKESQLGLSLLVNDFHPRNHLQNGWVFPENKMHFLHTNRVTRSPCFCKFIAFYLWSWTPATSPPCSIPHDANLFHNSMNYGHREGLGFNISSKYINTGVMSNKILSMTNFMSQIHNCCSLK
jgi:hypothetical protein